MLGSHCQFQSAPRLVAEENVLPIVSEHINSVSIRSAACGRGERSAAFAVSKSDDRFNPLRGLWPRRTPRPLTHMNQPPRFNPLRGLWPRRTLSPETKNRLYLLFQSAPRLVAAENKPPPLCANHVSCFNPLRGLWPRRTSFFCSAHPSASSFNPLRGLWPRRTLKAE